MTPRPPLRYGGKVVARASTKADGHRIEWMPLSETQKRHAPRNPKLHSVETIAASIRRHGFVSPLLLDERTGKLVAGHGRVEALVWLQAQPSEPMPRGVRGTAGAWMVPVVRGVAFKNARAAEAYLLIDNRATELGGWSNEELAPMLDALRKEGDDALAAVGWGEREVDRMLAELRGAEPDDGATRPRLAGLTYSLIVDCTGEDQQRTLLERFEREGLTCKPMVA